VRECPNCRLAITCDRLDAIDENKNKVQELLLQVEVVVGEGDYKKAKEMLKEISRINQSVLHNEAISAFVKQTRKKIIIAEKELLAIAK